MVGTMLGLGMLAASAGSQLIGAKMASNASKDAAKIQTQAADQAQKRYDASMKTTTDLYQPYLTAGRTAASTLGRLVTPGAGARYAAADPTQPKPQAPAGPPRAVPRTLGGMAPRAGGGGGGMVMVEAPDGSGVRPVPADQVDRFVSAGGRVVNTTPQRAMPDRGRMVA